MGALMAFKRARARQRTYKIVLLMLLLLVCLLTGNKMLTQTQT